MSALPGQILPSLTMLRNLDAACRHRNFRSAARELHLTHGAAIASVRKLEAALGEPMFYRPNGRIQPTRVALELAAEYRRTIAQIEGKWLQVCAATNRPNP